MKRALLVVDVQADLVDEPVHDRDRLLARIHGLVERARGAGAPVVWVQDDDVAAPGSPGWDIHPALSPRADETRIRKSACDAFHETDLGATLGGLGVAHLVICGCKTEFCIDTTVRRAITLGYGVTLVGDAHSTGGCRALDAAQVIAHHNASLHGFGALVAGTPCEVTVMTSDAVRF